MTVADALKEAKDALRFVPDRDVDCAWIVSFVCACSRSELHFLSSRVLTQKEEKLLKEILARRAEREPLQYIFGTVPFCNIELACDRRALIPRDETSLIVEHVLEQIAEKKYKTVLDLCTGSGAIALAVKKNSSCSVTASDISEESLSLARENALSLGLDVEFIKSDMFASLSGRKFDVIVSNPPYIPTKDIEKLERELSFEPECALDGGSDGLDFYREIAENAKQFLAPSGMLALEIGFDQAGAVRALLASSGFTETFVKCDYSHLDREVYCFNGEK